MCEWCSVGRGWGGKGERLRAESQGPGWAGAARSLFSLQSDQLHFLFCLLKLFLNFLWKKLILLLKNIWKVVGPPPAALGPWGVNAGRGRRRLTVVSSRDTVCSYTMLLFFHCCVIFHMDRGKPAFALPCISPCVPTAPTQGGECCHFGGESGIEGWR